MTESDGIRRHAVDWATSTLHRCVFSCASCLAARRIVASAAGLGNKAEYVAVNPFCPRVAQQMFKEADSDGNGSLDIDVRSPRRILLALREYPISLDRASNGSTSLPCCMPLSA